MIVEEEWLQSQKQEVRTEGEGVRVRERERDDVQLEGRRLRGKEGRKTRINCL